MSRSDARSNRLRRRPSRTVPAVIVSLILVALGGGLVGITVLRYLDGRWPSFLGAVNGWTTAQTWGSTTVVVITLAAVVLGLILLLAAWKPGQPKAIALRPEPITDDAGGTGDGSVGSTEFVMTRHAVAKLATAYADQVDGVDSVSTTVSARKVALKVRSDSEQRDELQDTITNRVYAALERAGVHPLPLVTTTVETRRL